MNVMMRAVVGGLLLWGGTEGSAWHGTEIYDRYAPIAVALTTNIEISTYDPDLFYYMSLPKLDVFLANYASSKLLDITYQVYDYTSSAGISYEFYRKYNAIGGLSSFTTGLFIKRLTDPADKSYKNVHTSKCCETCCYDHWRMFPFDTLNWEACYTHSNCVRACCVHSISYNPLASYPNTVCLGVNLNKIAYDEALKQVKCPTSNQVFYQCKAATQYLADGSTWTEFGEKCTQCRSCFSDPMVYTDKRGPVKTFPSCFDTLNTVCACQQPTCPSGQYKTNTMGSDPYCPICEKCATCKAYRSYACKPCKDYQNTGCCACTTRCPQNTYYAGGCLGDGSDTNCVECGPNMITLSDNNRGAETDYGDCFCRAGYILTFPSWTCNACPIGFYSSSQNSMKKDFSAVCSPCAVNYTSNEGSGSCTFLRNIVKSWITSDAYILTKPADMDIEILFREYVCDEGFTKNHNYANLQIDCARCKGNFTCPLNQYGICPGNSPTSSTYICKNCTNQPLNGYLKIDTTKFNSSACQPYCYKNWIYDTPSSSCIQICSTVASDYLSTVCLSAGLYTHASCLLTDTQINENVVCKLCTGLNSNEMFTGHGTVVNNASSCPKTCLPKHYYSGGQCFPWSAVTCNAGWQMMNASITRNYYCEQCPLVVVNTLKAFEPNSCQFNCTAGYFIDPDNPLECIPCPMGTYKDKASKTLCWSCSNLSYTTGMGSTQCKSVPSNAHSNPLRTFYICNDYFFPLEEDPTDPEPQCKPCSYNISNAVSYSFNKICELQVISCNNGFYAEPNDAAKTFSCVACPANLPSNMVYNPGISKIVNHYIKLNQVCGSHRNCTSQDRINIACIQNVKCNIGYYLSLSITSSKLSNTPSCSTCTSVSCGVGQYEQPCNGTTINYCVACPVLPEGTLYSSTGGCSGLTCDKGYYGPNTSNICPKCPIGKFKGTVGIAADCSSTCPSKGLFTYLQGSTACIECPAGTYNDNTAAISACFQCLPGKYANQSGLSECYACAISTIAPLNGMTACTPCTDILYSYAPSGSTACIIPSENCPAGLFMPTQTFWNEYSAFTVLSNSSTLCQPCLEGMYCPGDMKIYACSDGTRQNTYSKPFAKSLTNCTFFKSVGSFVSSTFPSGCPENTSTFGVKGVDHNFACLPQKPGYYGLPARPAKPCPRDFYCPFMDILEPIIACPQNSKWSESLSYQLSNCSSIMYPPCRPGYFLGYNPATAVKNQACEVCIQGYYCPGDDNMYACSNSTATSYGWSDVGSTGPSNCSTKTSLESGFNGSCPANSDVMAPAISGGPRNFHSIQQCVATAGYLFVPKYFNFPPVPCPRGFYCPAQTVYPVQCPPPHSCALGFTVVADRCPTTGLAAPLSSCSNCPLPLPTFAYWARLNSCDFCCNPNFQKIVNVQDPNQASYCIGLYSSIDCAAGQYALDPPENHACVNTVLSCASCEYSIPATAMAPGTSEYALYGNMHVALTREERQTLITNALARPRMQDSCHWNCKAGSYYNLATRTCTACPVGTFNDNPLTFNQTSCTDCPIGTYSSSIAATQCRTCGTWSFVQTSSCLTCKTYSNKTGKCIACQTWSSSSTRQSSCTCIAGTYLTSRTMPMEYDPQRFYTEYSCALCPIGTISKAGGVCTTCEAGTVCSINRLLDKPCSVGFFRATNQSTCAPCPLGLYSNESSATTCKQCDPGTFNGDLNATACARCPNATVSRTRASTQCSNCIDPNMTASADATDCECPMHWYSNEQECVQCKFRSCHANATLTPCLKGAKKDDSSCKCMQGFNGDGVSCVACNITSDCVCAVGERHLLMKVE